MSSLFVVSDCAGFIGVFDDAAKMSTALAQHGIPLRGEPGRPGVLTQRFDVAADHAGSPWVWLVPLAANGYIAFASKDRAAAETVRARFAEAGFVFDEDIDYWQQRPNEVRPEAAARYAPLPDTEAELEKLAREDDERSAALMRPRPGGPLEKAIADNAPLAGIGHYVVAADDFEMPPETDAPTAETDAPPAEKDSPPTEKDASPSSAEKDSSPSTEKDSSPSTEKDSSLTEAQIVS